MVQYSMECLLLELSNDVRNIIVVQKLFELEIKVVGRFAQSLVINHLESSDYCLKYMAWQFLYNFVIFEPTIMVQYSMECLFIELSNDVRNIIVVGILFELEIKVVGRLL